MLRTIVSTRARQRPCGCADARHVQREEPPRAPAGGRAEASSRPSSRRSRGHARACDADVVGLQEIGSSRWSCRCSTASRGTATRPVMGTRDARGIGCALLSRLPVREARVHTADALPFPRVPRTGTPRPSARASRCGAASCTRASRRPAWDPSTCWSRTSSRRAPCRTGRRRARLHRRRVNAHARRGRAVRSLVWRAAEALFVRGLVDDILATRSRARVAVPGRPQRLARLPRRLARCAARAPGALLDCAAGIGSRATVQPPRTTAARRRSTTSLASGALTPACAARAS